MMVGELEYADTTGELHSKSIPFIFFFFIIFVPIIINNLLIGLTVDNVDELTKQATLKGLESKISTIDTIDSGFLKKMFQKMGYSKRLDNIQEVCIHPGNR